MEPPFSPEFLFSCEHAGSQIPAKYQFLFEASDQILTSHRGWDPGALELAEALARQIGTQLFIYPYTRLFIETNRSIGHPELFSQFTRNLKKSEKLNVIKTYYLPYRNKVIEAIKNNLLKNIPTIHISIHTFTPVLERKKRNFEIGMLYDSQRKSEKDFCIIWKSLLKEAFPDYQIRMNQPYKGTSDGFTTYLRKTFDEKLYLGIELEVNQKLYVNNSFKWNQICSKIGDSLSVFSNLSS